MKCLRCKSVRLTHFIDGFGSKRIFCRGCWGSFPVETIMSTDQKNLHEFSFDTYHKLGFHDLR